MTIFTPQRPTASSTPATLTFTACTTADKFSTGGSGTWIILYNNGATPTAQCYVKDPVVTTPPGANTPATPTGASGWSDKLISNAIAASTSNLCVVIDAANVAQFTDSSGFVNLLHTTPTTLTCAVLGPY